MHSNIAKSLEKIVSQFGNINKLAKQIIKYGALIFLLVFAVGTAMIVINRTVFNLDTDFEFISINVVKTSFTLLAEAIIGGLVIDFITKKS